MKIKLKEAITMVDGVIYPKDYEFKCDCLVNVGNGFTQICHAVEEYTGIAMIGRYYIGLDDVKKLEIVLDTGE
jgi:hypothetical protein